MAMHVASRRGGWIYMFLRNANAACLNANCTPSPVFVRQTDLPTRFSVSELSYKGLVALAFPSVWDRANFFPLKYDPNYLLQYCFFATASGSRI